MPTNKMIFNLVTRIGVHGAKVGLWTPILVVKMMIILFVDISDYEVVTHQSSTKKPNSSKTDHID